MRTDDINKKNSKKIEDFKRLQLGKSKNIQLVKKLKKKAKNSFRNTKKIFEKFEKRQLVEKEE